MDLFPTLLEACGVKAEGKIDGVSLMPLFKGEALKRDALYWYYPHYSNQGGHPNNRDPEAGDFKLIEFFEDGRRELYDLLQDAGESHNLIADKPEVAKELGDKLDTWRKEVGARPMKPNPDFVPNPQAKDGTILLHSRTAEVHGLQLRYEPLPHKNTLGYWTRAEDWASWEFTVTTPAAIRGRGVAGLRQGPGRQHGGGVARRADADVHRGGHGPLPELQGARDRPRDGGQGRALIR